MHRCYTNCIVTVRREVSVHVRSEEAGETVRVGTLF